jgi:hypothetical protein
MSTTLDVIRDRVASLCASTPFNFLEAETPFSFDLQPSGSIDQVFRLETEGGGVIGGFNYTEERTDLIQVWLARKQGADPTLTYRTLLADASSMRAAVIRDGATGGGDYDVPDDGAGLSIQHDPGVTFAVLRLTVPVNYEAQL